jgi:MSHA pilin protein MshA
LEADFMGKATQRGFTLIELVVVIVILGILSAFAVPRFMGLETQARVASLTSLQGSVRSAASLAHSVWLANGSTGNITVEGTAVTMTNGYPSLADLTKTLQDTTGFSYDSTTGKFTVTNAPTAANCSFTYTAPAALGSGPTFSTPTTSGC